MGEQDSTTVGVSHARIARPLRSRLLGRLGAALLKLLMCTYRYKLVGDVPASLATAGPKLFAFWHNQQLLVSKFFWLSGRVNYSNGVYGLASRHADGQIIAEAVERMGFFTEAGSSSRGGAEALMALRRRVLEGFDCAVTPDGPKGPPFVAKGGIVMLAKSCHVPVFPVAYSCSIESAWNFKRAWDGMFLPKPFATIFWSIGEPLFFEVESDIKQGVERLNQALAFVNGGVAEAAGYNRGRAMQYGTAASRERSGDTVR